MKKIDKKSFTALAKRVAKILAEERNMVEYLVGREREMIKEQLGEYTELRNVEGMSAYIGVQKPMCTKDFYEMRKDHWYVEVWTPYIKWFEYTPFLRDFGYWKKIPYQPWQSFYCSKHKKGHEKS